MEGEPVVEAAGGQGSDRGLVDGRGSLEGDRHCTGRRGDPQTGDVTILREARLQPIDERRRTRLGKRPHKGFRKVRYGQQRGEARPTDRDRGILGQRQHGLAKPRRREDAAFILTSAARQVAQGFDRGDAGLDLGRVRPRGDRVFQQRKRALISACPVSSTCRNGGSRGRLHPGILAPKPSLQRGADPRLVHIDQGGEGCGSHTRTRVGGPVEQRLRLGLARHCGTDAKQRLDLEDLGVSLGQLVHTRGATSQRGEVTTSDRREQLGLTQREGQRLPTSPLRLVSRGPERQPKRRKAAQQLRCSHDGVPQSDQRDQ